MKPFACTPAEGKPITASPASIARAVDSRSRSTIPTQVPAKSSSLVPVDPGKLGRLAADQRDSRLAADLGRTLDELRNLLEIDPVGGDVVEEDERVGARRRDVVDAVGGEVGAAGAQPPARAREDQLRPDRVGGSGEKPLVVERMEARRTRRSPVAPVDSAAARSRSTTASPVASETPACAYVWRSLATVESSRAWVRLADPGGVLPTTGQAEA